MISRKSWFVVGVALALPGCVLAPRATEQQRQEVEDAGRAYQRPAAERSVPDLSPQADWRELLQRALAVNGEIEAAYFDWSAAVSRIDVAAGYPNANLSLSYSYLFGGGNMKAWDRNTLALGVDPMQNLTLPPKVWVAGRVALEEARAAASRLRLAKFTLQQRVLSAYFDFALGAERLRLQRELLSLLDLMTVVADVRAGAGASQQGSVRAALALQLEEDRRRALEAELAQQRALLNGMVGRPPDAALDPPSAVPSPRRAPDDDATLLAIGVDENPELQSLLHAVSGGEHLVDLARLQILPDINPFVSINGGVQRLVGATLILSTTLPQIRANIAASEAQLRAQQALLRQTTADRASQYVATLLSLRDSERQVSLLEQRILPMAILAADLARQEYVGGDGELTSLLESQRAAVDLRAVLAAARIARELRLVDLEALAGVDIETLGTTPTLAMSGAEVQP